MVIGFVIILAATLGGPLQAKEPMPTPGYAEEICESECGTTLTTSVSIAGDCYLKGRVRVEFMESIFRIFIHPKDPDQTTARVIEIPMKKGFVIKTRVKTLNTLEGWSGVYVNSLEVFNLKGMLKNTERPNEGFDLRWEAEKGTFYINLKGVEVQTFVHPQRASTTPSTRRGAAEEPKVLPPAEEKKTVCNCHAWWNYRQKNKKPDWKTLMKYNIRVNH